MKNIPYVLYQESEGDWTIYALHYPVSTCGDTKEEALKMFREALELYFEEEEYMEAPVQFPEFGQLALNA